MKDLTVGRLAFEWGSRTYVMGIVNVTPDSFSGDGLIGEGGDWIAAAVARARQFFAEGADLVDIGGESTRPGSSPIPAAEEIQRVVPVVQRLVAAGLGPLSVDTYKAEVARAVLEAGADMINDIWGLRADPAMAAVVAGHNVPVILMLNRTRPQGVTTDSPMAASYVGAQYADLLGDVSRELLECVALAHQAGIPDEHIIIDPGIGFGKTVSQNLDLIDRLGELRALGYPVRVGPSRKSFIGRGLDLPADQRVEGTLAAVAIAIARGADIVRVHDVATMVRVARMSDALVRPRPAHQPAAAG